MAKLTRRQSAGYTSCDPRWMTDFEDAADAAGIPWLVSIGAGDREGEHLERCLKIDQNRGMNTGARNISSETLTETAG